jgi:hypothetical protein
VENAARAGAFAVLLYGDRLPPGALGLDQNVAVPVAGVPSRAALLLDAALRSRVSVSVSLGAPGSHASSTVAQVAGFSSTGFAYDGGLKPNLAGPGVALGTAEPGVNLDGSPAFGTVNGSSAAAATVAGAAALLAHARPGLDAPGLRSVLVDSARPLPGESVAAEGAGLVDVGAAAAAEVATDPVGLSFSSTGERRTVRLRNISPRNLLVVVTAGRTAPLSVTPRRLELRRGGVAAVTVSVRPGRLPPPGRLVHGALRIQPRGGQPVRVPWGAMRRRPRGALIRSVSLRDTASVPSEASPAFLSIRAGRILPPAEVQAISRLDIELWNSRGKRLGLLARLRDALPGLYQFGLTGRGPAGQLLGHGRYRIRLVAVPTDGGHATVRGMDFVIGRRPKVAVPKAP